MSAAVLQVPNIKYEGYRQQKLSPDDHRKGGLIIKADLPIRLGQIIRISVLLIQKSLQ